MFPYFLFPLASGCAWIGTILGLVIPWLEQERPRLPSFEANQTIPFISDLGAFNKQLFIGGCSATAGFYLITLICDRILHGRRLPGRASCGETTFSLIAIVTAVVGAAALVLLSIFDNFNFKELHDKLVLVFIAGNFVSSFALVIEYSVVYQRRVLPIVNETMARRSIQMKIIYLVLDIGATVGLVIAGQVQKNEDLGAIFEYVTAGLFAWYIFSFMLDLSKYPSAAEYQQLVAPENGGGPVLKGQPDGSSDLKYEQMRV